MNGRIFVYEYTCAAGRRDADKLSSLRAEGAAMLAAILADLSRIPGIELVTLLGRGARTSLPGHACRLAETDEEEAGFRELTRTADYTLVIAPEVDRILWTRCRWAEASGGRLLGPSSATVQLVGDKWALSRHLHQRAVPTPACRPVAATTSDCPFSFPVVCKPRFGAGSLATFLVRDEREWARCVDAGRAGGWTDTGLVQPFVPGQAASVAFLVGPAQSVALLPATQELSSDGRFRYCGGRIPLPSPQATRAVRLASQAIHAVPSLRGYVGVDVVLGDAEDGSGDSVMEINPRLTTSYAGLRALARTNLAEAMVRVATGEQMPALTWSAGSVRFRADGTTTAA